MNAEGYLTLTGRLKEIFNRGGEKISPREVDEVLMNHPAVQQVITFAMPHDKLGEDVAAAVVLREGARDGERVARIRQPTRRRSKCRERFYSWMKFPRARPANCSESAWPRNLGGHRSIEPAPEYRLVA